MNLETRKLKVIECLIHLQDQGLIKSTPDSSDEHKESVKISVHLW